MTQILIAYEKDGPRHISMAKGIGPTARALLAERVDLGVWYDTTAYLRAQHALIGDDPKLTPWHFLISRNGFEYERVEIVDLEEIA